VTSQAPRDWPWLPHLLFDMARRFGLDTALRFAQRHGGTLIYLPVRPAAGHEIAQAFGQPLLAWLIEHQGGGQRVLVPMGPSQSQAQREAAVRSLTAQGLRKGQIARKLGIHVRTVSAIRARQRGQDGTAQMNLFGEPEA
jgi:DNA-binding CsgD family transcriptional regulator